MRHTGRARHMRRRQCGGSEANILVHWSVRLAVTLHFVCQGSRLDFDFWLSGKSAGFISAFAAEAWFLSCAVTISETVTESEFRLLLIENFNPFTLRRGRKASAQIFEEPQGARKHFPFCRSLFSSCVLIFQFETSAFCGCPALDRKSCATI